MSELKEATQEELNLALVCGLLRRWGPSPAQLAELPWRRRAVCRLLPRRSRWRVHPLAPMIRAFERRLDTRAATPRRGNDDQ